MTNQALINSPIFREGPTPPGRAENTGTISLIEPGTLVVALGTYAPLFDKAMSNVVEVKARGAEVLALTTEDFREKDGEGLPTPLSLCR